MSEGLCGVDGIWNTGIGYGPQRIGSDQRLLQGIQGWDWTKEGSPRGSVGVGKWLDGDL